MLPRENWYLTSFGVLEFKRLNFEKGIMINCNHVPASWVWGEGGGKIPGDLC